MKWVLIQRSITMAFGFLALFASCIVSGEELYFVHTDHLGTPQVVTDASQATVWEGRQTPFGETEVITNQIEMNVRFPGQYYDQESGLSYNYFRDYDPSLGRYVQSDPIGLDGGVNTYGYTLQNPILNIDPTGEMSIAGGLAGAGMLGSVYCLLNQAHCQQLSQLCSDALDNLTSMKDPESKENKCDMKLIRKMPSYDGKTFSCVYTSKGSTFTFPQAVGYACPSIDMERCLVNTNEIMPPARY